jgi:hypothetical protein
MPRATATVSFQAIELKGSLLPASLLEQVARLQAPMQKEADYGLAKGERLREQIDAVWVRLKEIWEEHRDLREGRWRGRFIGRHQSNDREQHGIHPVGPEPLTPDPSPLKGQARLLPAVAGRQEMGMEGVGANAQASGLGSPLREAPLLRGG